LIRVRAVDDALGAVGRAEHQLAQPAVARQQADGALEEARETAPRVLVGRRLFGERDDFADALFEQRVEQAAPCSGSAGRTVPTPTPASLAISSSVMPSPALREALAGGFEDALAVCARRRGEGWSRRQV
jgi:hypothetical protein